MTAHITTRAEAPVAKRGVSGPSISNLLRWAPSMLWILAAALLAVSILIPYWGMTLHAPQYPGGLSIRVFVNVMTGDEDPTMDEVREIDGLNHYIGMRPLSEAAQFERSIAIPAIALFAAFLLVAALWWRRWTWLLTVPPLFFPIVFLGDMAYWLNEFGQNLDPAAPLSSAIRPFTPPLLGEGRVGQFSTVAHLDMGWYVAALASILTLVGLLIRLWQARQQAATPQA